jgi:hypothetical protein
VALTSANLGDKTRPEQRGLSNVARSTRQGPAGFSESRRALIGLRNRWFRIQVDPIQPTHTANVGVVDPTTGKVLPSSRSCDPASPKPRWGVLWHRRSYLWAW